MLALLIALQSAPSAQPADELRRIEEMQTAQERAKEQEQTPTKSTDTNSARPGDLEQMFNACMDIAVNNPAEAVSLANDWRISGGGYLALQCIGFAQAELEEWDLSRRAFVEAAREAEQARDKRAAQLWAQAGNAALAGGDSAKALEYFDAALLQDGLAGLNRGEVHLDRARALVMLERTDEARAEFDQVQQLAPEDPLGWLLSATLARRTGDMKRAEADIARAVRLAPNDPAISLELGNIAAAKGEYDRAREQWRNVITLAKDSREADTAARRIAELDSESGEGE